MSKSDITEYIIYKLKFPLRISPTAYFMVGGYLLLMVGVGFSSLWIVGLGIFLLAAPVMKGYFQYDYNKWKRQRTNQKETP